MFTVFGVIHRKAAAGFAGLVIGLVVFAAIIPVAPATGASINPARTTGLMLVQQAPRRTRCSGSSGRCTSSPSWPAASSPAWPSGLISRTQADRTTLTEALVEEEARA